MPTWSHDIPKDPRGPAFPVIRTPPNKPITAIVTSEDLVGTFTHYFHGRTMPCESESCLACSEGIPFRWHAYVSAWQQGSGLHFLFECTAQAAESFTTFRDAHGTLRGCLFQATRMNQKANGRIQIQTKPVDQTVVFLPEPPDICKCLAILWNLPSKSVAAETINPAKKTIHIKPK